MSATMVDSNTTYFRPQSENDWETWRPLFTRYYIEENRPLPKVMEIMKDEHRFWASEKMYKNKIKAWNLRKYLREDEAKQIVDGEVSPTEAMATHVANDPEEMKERAARSLKRKRARQRAQTLHQTSSMASGSSPAPSSPASSTSSAVVLRRSSQNSMPTPLFEGLHISGVTDHFLFNLRRWTHDAYVFGHWDTPQSSDHRSGRQASRQLSSHLNAGINLFENGKQDLAWTQWHRALAGFQNPDLFKSWYHEIPMALLHEVGRVAHSGHLQLAAMLLKCVKSWAHNFLREDDSRHALFSLFGEIEVEQLRDLYGRAARCLYNGLESRVDKHSKLLYDVRLNRALDMLWYDPEADLTDWLPRIEDVDNACGPDNAYAVYFMLLEAYRLVAQESYVEADAIGTQVRKRLTSTTEGPGGVDPWRVGLAYRRLGRQQHSKGRYTDARRSFNTALKYVRGDDDLSNSVLIEICQRQQSMANEVQDQEDVFFWNTMLSRLEQQTKVQGEAEMLSPEADAEDDDDNENVVTINPKKRRLDIPTTSVRRSNTL